MKICHIISGLKSGGAEGVLFRLVNSDKKNYHIVISLTQGGLYSEKFKNSKVELYELNFTGINLFSFMSFLKLFFVILKKRPDVVQTWMYHADLIGSIAARLTGVKKIFWNIRNSDLDIIWSNKRTIQIMRICSFFSNILPTKIICCSKKSYHTHILYGYNKKKLIIIFNGYDIRKFKSNIETKEKLRKKFFIKKKEIILGFVARWSRQKDFELVFGAFKIALIKNKNIKLLLVGQGISKQNQNLIKLLRKFNIIDKTVLVNETDKVHHLLNLIDLGIFASKGNEGFPNVVAEKMLMGIPMISNDQGDAKLIIKNLGKVILNPNKHQFYNLIDRNINLYDTKKKNSLIYSKYILRKSIERRFSLNQMVNQYIKLWNL